MTREVQDVDERDSKWCVLGRWRQEIGTWSWVCIVGAPSAKAALEQAKDRGNIHGYYVAIPWDVQAKGETKVLFKDA